MAGQMGQSLPGSRPDRAAANNRRNASDMGQEVVADQGGFGAEDMERSADYLSTANLAPTEPCNMPPDLASMGDGGQSFGGI